MAAIQYENTDGINQTNVSVATPLPVSLQASGGNSAVTVADGADVTQGSKADAKSTATDTTPVSVVSVLKQISASVQAPPSQAATVADGSDVTKGAKADAAATDSTSSWSVIALLKGIVAQLLSTAPVQTFASDTYQNIAAGTATTTVKSGAGTLRGISINTKGASSNVITVYDNTAASGTLIATIDGTSDRDHIYDVAFATGLTVKSTTGTGADMTIRYR